MGTRNRWSGRAFTRTLLLLIIAALVTVAGALPGDPAGAAKKAPPGDPPGNNGTVKIDQSDEADEDKGNEPIGEDCSFWLKFYNFDLGQKADIASPPIPPPVAGIRSSTRTCSSVTTRPAAVRTRTRFSPTT